jgi:DNA invertase Pin-like site-specific DNA recombinase
LGPTRAAPYAAALREGDAVVVWKLDRLSRSLNDVLHIMELRRAGFRSITENIDTTVRLMMQMIGSFAEFERATIRERTSAGTAAARAHRRSTQEARHRQTARDRAPLQHQLAHRVTDCRPASDGQA